MRCLNHTEKRRRQLLDETRKLYSDRYIPPAIHPRYGYIYDQLYEKDSKEKGGSFELRVFLCMLILAAFITADKNEKFTEKYDTEAVIECISVDMEILNVIEQ